jgi:hypothetical protein
MMMAMEGASSCPSRRDGTGTTLSSISMAIVLMG